MNRKCNGTGNLKKMNVSMVRMAHVDGIPLRNQQSGDKFTAAKK
jgi:hypothetical protein